MKRFVQALSVLVIVLLIASANPLHAQAIRVKGTSVSMTPPEGFVDSEAFPGFQQDESGSSIMITEMPAPISKLIEAFTEAGLKSQGIRLISNTEITRGDYTGVEVHAAQSAAGVNYLKWMIVIGTEKNSVMIVGAYPEDFEAGLGDSIRDSIRGALWESAMERDLFEGLNFRVTPTRKLKLASRVSSFITLTGSGKETSASVHDPLLLVGHSYSDQKIENLKEFAQARAFQTVQMKNFEVLSGKATKLDGLPAYELVIKAHDLKTDTEMRLYQVLAIGADRYFLIQGLITAKKWKPLESEFRKVTESFKLVPEKDTDKK